MSMNPSKSASVVDEREKALVVRLGEIRREISEPGLYFKLPFVESSGREEVTGANMLVAIFAQRESHAAFFLQEQNMMRYDAVSFISHGIAKRHGASDARPVRGTEEDAPEEQSGEQSKVKDGEVHTPVPNGTFLVGSTRGRVIELLRHAGVAVHERSLAWQEFVDADEVFSTGNHGKVLPVTRVESRHLQPGPVMHKARELYWEFAHSGAV